MRPEFTEEVVVPGVAGERQVHVPPPARPLTDLVGVAREVGEGGCRTAVHGDVQDVVAGPEDVLCAVAVVVVDVEHPGPAPGGQVTGRHRRPVEQAEPAVVVAPRVVPRRSGERVGERGAVSDGVGGGQRDVDGRAGCLVAARDDRGRGVEAPPADVAEVRRARLAATTQTGDRERVGDHDLRAAAGTPAVVAVGQERDQVGVVDGQQWTVVVRLRWALIHVPKP